LTLQRQWRAVRASLPDGWGDARLLLRTEGEGTAQRANALLAPLASSRSGQDVRFGVSRVSGPGEDAVRRLLGRLDREGVRGTLELAAVAETAPQPAGSVPQELPAAGLAPLRLSAGRAKPLAEQWDEAAAELPPDWSDLLAEVEIDSSDLLDRTALLLGPVNPARDGERLAFRFRCARTRGYGAAPGMTRRCLARVDGDGIPGRLKVLRALSETEHVYTQGPVWYVGGKAV
jgi:hypothetical protein